MAAVMFNNFQLLADHIAVQISRSHQHKKCIYMICKQLNKLIRARSSIIYRYRIGLYGRVNNATRSRAVFFSSKIFTRPKKNTFFTKIYFAESSAIAKIGAFHIRL